MFLLQSIIFFNAKMIFGVKIKKNNKIVIKYCKKIIVLGFKTEQLLSVLFKLFT